MTEHEKEMYDKGVQVGLEAYAWMKDDMIFVGSCGTTLKMALAARKTLARYNPEFALQQIIEGAP